MYTFTVMQMLYKSVKQSLSYTSDFCKKKKRIN